MLAARFVTLIGARFTLFDSPVVKCFADVGPPRALPQGRDLAPEGRQGSHRVAGNGS
jgi:hypothetical protein